MSDEDPFRNLIRAIHPRGETLSVEELDSIIAICFNVYSTLVGPIAGIFGWMNYRPIDSPQTFWIFMGLGAFALLQGIISFAIASGARHDNDMIVGTTTKHSKKKVKSIGKFFTGTGAGLICYALGGFAADAHRLGEFYGAVQFLFQFAK